MVRTECAWCGPVELPPVEMRCGIDPTSRGEGLCEFLCPVCGRLGYAHTTAEGVELLACEGATRVARGLPFELLEPHAGAPLSWDDLLDAVLSMASTALPQDQPVQRRGPA